MARVTRQPELVQSSASWSDWLAENASWRQLQTQPEATTQVCQARFNSFCCFSLPLARDC